MRKRFLWIVPALLLPSCKIYVTTYRVTWLNYDGSVLEVDEAVTKTFLPSYDGPTPEKPRDEFYEYVFVGWDKEVVPAGEDAAYSASFERRRWNNDLIFSHDSGFYDEPFSLSIRAAEEFDIHYTLDCGIPDETSSKYEGPIAITDPSSEDNYFSSKTGISSLDVYYPSGLVDKCRIVKAIGIDRQTRQKTDVFDLCFFVGYQGKEGYGKLPIISLSMDEADLFDYEKGIYVTGRIYDESEHTGYPETYPANYNQKGKEWERPANFKYFDPEGKLLLDQDIGVRIHGGWSRAFNQKSFNLYARKEYSGSARFGHPFFGGIKAHSLMLRSGGYRDTALTKVRDSLNQDLSEPNGFATQRSAPSIVFLNGEYWGIYNLQERFSDNYVEEHDGVRKENVVIIKNDEIDEGVDAFLPLYEEMKAFFAEQDLTIESNYEAAQSYIDLQEFASYMATELYVGNIDWPGNNVRLYKDASDPGSKWHFMMYDTDDSGGILSHMCAPEIDPFLRKSHWKSGPLESDCLLGSMLSKLVENPSFRQLFRATFLDMGKTHFAKEAVAAYL
ncbi:MAG: CotH kinase family protein, partial [Bacilli bacterium]|nr:CotH kinase family protein [Bacilli bacterium]